MKKIFIEASQQDKVILNRIKELVNSTPDAVSVDVDYSELKLHHLSILWRATVHSPKYLPPLDLGADAEIIRNMILDGDPGDDSYFPLHAFAVTRENQLFREFATYPQKSKSEYGMIYHYMHSGMEWATMTPDAIDIPQLIIDFRLKSNETLPIKYISHTDALSIPKIISKE